jgi:hypothetical protein
MTGKSFDILKNDFMFFEKASRAMDNDSHAGLFR